MHNANFKFRGAAGPKPGQSAQVDAELKPALSLAENDMAGAMSPARVQQAWLDGALKTSAAPDRYPVAVRFALIFGGSALLWAGIVRAVSPLF